MAEDHFLDLMETGGKMWIKAWRCLNCGNVLDHVMELNRAQHLVPHVSASVNDGDAGLVGTAARFPRAA